MAITHPGWQRPRLRLLDTGERRATWLELLYDLVFVVAVAELAGLLGEHDLTGFLGLFVPVWWAWAGYVFYANRFDTDDLSHRLLVGAQLLAVVLMAAALGDPVNRSALFAVAYVAVRLLLIVAYLRVSRHVPQARRLALSYVTGFSAAAAIWLLSLALTGPARYAAWAVAMVVDLATPLVSRRYQGELPPQSEHLPERFGLFVVIVLGEVVAAIVLGVKGHALTPLTLLIAAAGVAVTVVVWSLYFDRLDGRVVLRTRAAGQIWVYSHLPLAMALVAFGVGVEQLILHPGGYAAALIGAALVVVAATLAAQRKVSR
ncbi:low temperature requirement protein A [Nonomuraea sp. NPDC050328]|uniref:low temperature requirement protein A n=1 Tax=Nonomuraea sp. NPDC050328 TaxID=3364361 RepID=UPI0037BA0F7D